ncbi:putative ribonuclease h protein at1g65750 [Phtheirospermum japonicum]|uniref:Putative ribonuclease h protein at1g65750 n=1 Tax=Phtheirospermum japonicum TaxID=374723 RepID=A0A830C008_9LAMI|nr:putative ribonuclease h protein at1g65750 [Phtheirospermum japonicum]
MVLAHWFRQGTGKIHIFRILPILILWFLWCSRNDKQVKNIPFTGERVCNRIWKYLNIIKDSKCIKPKAWSNAPLIYDLLSIDTITRPPPAKIIVVRWSKPPIGTIKINTDGASKGNTGEASAGGLARDHTARPIFAFHEYLGQHTNTFAELHAIWRALDLCHDRNITRFGWK